ncbi:MAG: HNH endonuclease [Cytophagales bacterium]|nr:HNH endonuclease [Cytophagales bacterium]
MAQFGLEAYIPRQHYTAMKRQLREKWSYECAYCGAKEKTKELTLDHVIPLAHGGTDDYNNLVPACSRCNLDKSDTPLEEWFVTKSYYTEDRWLKIQEHIHNVLTI